MIYKPSFSFDENLRDIPEDIDSLMEHVIDLQSTVPSIQDLKIKVDVMGELGVYLRCLGKLEAAEQNLVNALEIICQNNLGLRKEVQQKIRLAHVLQWKKSFEKSDALFNEILHICRTHSEAKVYLDFALQHAGKNFFDQKRFREALTCFEEAKKLRIERESPKDQLQSTELAIQRTRYLMVSM